MAKEAPIGSRVELSVSTTNGDKSYEGTLIPPAGTGLVTIKLENGYNLSHLEASVQGITVLGPGPSSSSGPSGELPEDESLPEVLLIHTGGTIASKVDYATGAVTTRFEPEEILASVPELRSIARLRVRMLGNMWSDDVRPRHWNGMIEATREAFDQGYAGVVITHGTDTLHLSAAALAYAWSGCGGRPPGRIVLTGSQRSPDRGSSDAYENLIAAVHWAASGPDPTGHRDASVVVMHDTGSDGRCVVLPGCSSRKAHSTRRGAFVVVNQGPIGHISLRSGHPVIEAPEPRGAQREVESSPTRFDEDISIQEFVAGPHLSPSMIRAAVKGGLDAIVVRGTGLGHLPIHDPLGDSPENPELASVLRDAVSEGVPVVVTAETVSGMVNMDVYAKGRDQRSIGLIGHGSLCPPGSAVIKLHHLLSRGMGIDEIRGAWSRDLVGENPPDSRG